jgi:hypothetical protein
MYLGSDVDTRQDATEPTSVEVGSRPGEGDVPGPAREGCVGWRPRYGHSSHGMRMTLPPEWPVSMIRWAFAASLSGAGRFGQVSAAGSRLTQQEAVAAVRDRHGTGTAAP